MFFSVSEELERNVIVESTQSKKEEAERNVIMESSQSKKEEVEGGTFKLESLPKRLRHNTYS